MKKLQSFNSTPELFEHIATLLGSGVASNKKVAGDLFEQYTREHHLAFSDYVEVYDANDKIKIPDWVVDTIDGWELLNKGANSYAIDKICVTRNGDIDIHQDKSTLDMDKNLSTGMAEGMMSVRNNPLKNVRNYVINTTARDISHYASLWKDQPVICYGSNYFADEDTEAIKRDKIFWANLKLKQKNKPVTKIYNFVPRNVGQTEYIDAGVNFATASFQQSKSAKWHQLAVGGLGKSVLDAVLLTELEDLFDPVLTNTPQSVSVSFYHSSKTLPKNGLEEVQRRRAKGFYDEVFVVSGTSVTDGEDDNNLRSIFPKETKPANAVDRIKKALDTNKKVLILTLYHHGEQIERIKNLLNDSYPGFKFWYRKRDECDWPAGDPDNSYAPGLDNRTESILTFGSSGTERVSKDPLGYGTNNVSIHGPCVHKFTWGQAEDQGLVKPLILITPTVKESDIANWYPEFVDTKTGRVAWDMRVKGQSVNGEMPTVGLIADLTALAKTLVKYPQIKNLLGFSHRVKTNALAQANWADVCKKVLGNSAQDKKVKKLFWQVLNDDKYNSASIQDDKWAIKKALKHERNIVAACKLIGRGYDEPRHHAAIHFDPKSIVNTTQEIWRAVRKDDTTQDPFSYYILPMRYNDLDHEPSFSEERLAQLQGILEQHDPIRDEFELLTQTPNSGSKKKNRKLGQRIFLPEDFDPTQLGGLYTWYQHSRKLEILEDLYGEAHSWLLKRYIETPNFSPNNNKQMGKIRKEFFEQERFQPLFACYKLAKTSPVDFKANFWGGAYLKGSTNYSMELKHLVDGNILAYKEFRTKVEAQRKQVDAQIKKEAPELAGKVLFTGRRFFNVTQVLSEKHSLSTAIVNRTIDNLYATLQTNNTHWKKIHDKALRILIDQADKSSGYNEWATNAIDQFESNGISTHNLSGIIIQKAFIRNKDGLLNKTQFAKIYKLAPGVKSRGLTKVSLAKYQKEGNYASDPYNRKSKKTK
jgi:hypothetical protein